MKRLSQRGVALVITLIMLAVITVMAVAFLALSRRERTSVTQAAHLADAQLMADAALERAKGIAVVSMLTTTNLLAPDLIVSRNYINSKGFDPAAPPNPLNVNYDYTINNTPLTKNDLIQNIANLFYDPRPPVFVSTNYNPARPLDFRFYVDLNRNRRFDTNGVLPVFDELGNVVGTNAQFFVGDLEWIGVPERPNLPHSQTNKFMGRYAFLIQPIGKSLDFNFIHNHGKETLNNGLNGFFRNQGFGPWEINLAAFLVDLNTNQWTLTPYNYETNLTSQSTGIAFDDARELLNYRYRGTFQNLLSVRTLFGPPGATAFRTDAIDGYANGLLDVTGYEDDPGKAWPGADSVQHFFSVHDLFGAPRPPNYPNFITRLAAASARSNSYDRYTYYRLLAQMGTDSGNETPRATPGKLMQKISANAPGEFPAEPVGKINLNYDNIDYDAARFVPWDPAKFFTNVANVLLRAHFPFGITNIMVYPTNYYTPPVHRLLQMAANIYDASNTNQFPSVFRPVFATNNASAANATVFIVGYYEDGLTNTIDALPTHETYGVPFVVGAKKGIPNFNEYVMQTFVEAARKLEVRRNTNTSAITMTNEMFLLTITNFFGLESWNSYTQAFGRDVVLQVRNDVSFTVTNQEGLYTNQFLTNLGYLNIPAGQWAGFKPTPFFKGGFRMPIYTNTIFLTNAVYRLTPAPPHFDRVGQNIFETRTGFGTPRWSLLISNRLTYVLSSGPRILDYVHLRNLDNYVDISGYLMSTANPDVVQKTAAAGCWDTNLVKASDPNSPTLGIQRQIDISLEDRGADADWVGYNLPGSLTSKNLEIDKFLVFFGRQPKHGYTNVANTLDAIQAPFTPARKFVQTTIWAANDPMVHYMVDHLRDVTNNIETKYVKPIEPDIQGGTLNEVNNRYMPWGGNKRLTSNDDPAECYPGVKDPGVRKSDDWDFPTNKYPNIGWLGRIHRGTPWQTVYLKAEAATGTQWNKQFIDPGLVAHPTNDWRLLDMFTVATYPLASRGQLSINQANLAAWSAVLSGVSVLSNAPVPPTAPPQLVEWVIEPNSLPIVAIVDGINRERARYPGGVFRRLGDILSVPELSVGRLNAPTVNSPFVRAEQTDLLNGLTEEAVERIPRQILSLLKLGDARYIIYAFGQSLKPAPNSILTSGTYAGMCTNYQITGEVVTRSVMRIDGTAAKPQVVLEKFNLLPSD